MTDLSYNRLYETLLDFSERESIDFDDQVALITQVMIDTWTMIDSLHRLGCLSVT
jgi:hypothetical protein